jgi:hypothetical protein
MREYESGHNGHFGSEIEIDRLEGVQQQGHRLVEAREGGGLKEGVEVGMIHVWTQGDPLL